MQLLFVCTGNICRSPIAERLASAWSARSDTIDLTVASAGTRAVVGSPMEPKAAQVLSDLGGSPDGFVARQINPAVTSSADLVLTMTEEHRDAVLKLSPRHLKRTFTLLEAAQIAREIGPATVAEFAAARAIVTRAGMIDVPDPIRQSTRAFEDAGKLIEQALEGLLRNIRFDR
ncbi:low molecular weight phosphatase family protein [Rhodococcus hoagii]|uniref:arsenate reductase/protein-tyrosine-phosphatase family protein n=1 Tax=Rhodococcus hoagii TaxID=43767 RepID=UPI0019642109|nr:low molecular weight phosphatase family protein [Prescottella equi]MBM9838419.1 low molecular weight phosphatase family protein [Prescottella equi]